MISVTINNRGWGWCCKNFAESDEKRRKRLWNGDGKVKKFLKCKFWETFL